MNNRKERDLEASFSLYDFHNNTLSQNIYYQNPAINNNFNLNMSANLNNYYNGSGININLSMNKNCSKEF